MICIVAVEHTVDRWGDGGGGDPVKDLYGGKLQIWTTIMGVVIIQLA